MGMSRSTGPRACPLGVGALVATLAVTAATPAAAQDAGTGEPEAGYPGLRAEIGDAAGVLRLRVERSRPVDLPPGFDWRTDGPAPRLRIEATVVRVLRGDLAAPGDRLTLHMAYAESRRRYERTLRGIANLFFANVPPRGSEAVFLVRRSGSDLEVSNVVLGHRAGSGETGRREDDAFMKRYVEIAEMEPADAALALTALTCERAFGDAPRDVAGGKSAVCRDDWSRLAEHLPRESEALGELISRWRPAVLEQARDGDLESVVWLARLMPDDARKEVVAALLARYDEAVARSRRQPPAPAGPRGEGCMTAEEMRALSTATLRASLPDAIAAVMDPDAPARPGGGRGDRGAEEAISRARELTSGR